MEIAELVLRAIIFVFACVGIVLAFKLVVAIFRAIPSVLKLFSPRSLGRASAFVERKTKSAIQSFQDGRRS